MKVVILAAGMGKRLGKYTAEGTKCLVKVNGRSLIEYTIDALLESGLRDIILVLGYKADVLQSFLAENYPDLTFTFVHNPIYDKTNNIYSLWLAKEHLIEDDTLLLESDLIFDPSIIRELVESPEKNLAVVSKFESWMDGTVTLLDPDDRITSVIDKRNFKWIDTESYYKTVNIYKFSKEFMHDHYLPFLNAYLESFGNNDYYEQVLRVLTFLDHTNLKGLKVSGRKWYEIDDPHDLHVAETLFCGRDRKLALMEERYGGYWRFPGMLDFCYLVNPYFPPPRMWEELKAGFIDAVSQYPSGMKIQSILAGKIYGIEPNNIAVGNGAAELIASLFRVTTRGVGFISPCFNEYPARIGADRMIVHHASRPDFTYDPVAPVQTWKGKAEWGVLVNPDNPSGHFLDAGQIGAFVSACEAASIRPVIDESFVDFAQAGKRFTLLDDTFLQAHPSVVVIRSISKSYGIPGLRLGVVASGDTRLVSAIKKDVAIWNINSMGEFFLQIFDKYKKDYLHACDRIAVEREVLQEALVRELGFKVAPSQANYLLCDVSSLGTANKIAQELLMGHQILSKSLTSKEAFKEGQFMRFAVRTREDNLRLVSALRAIQANY